jgi:cyanuric acid amidohydrolase
MAIEVAKVILKNVQDASEMEERIRAGQFTADQVVAVVGKTEGNGGVNDFTRILADQAFRAVLVKHGKRSAEAVKQIPMVWSGGCDGVITPHATVFAQNAKTGPASKARLALGTAMSPQIFPEDIGRSAMVEKIAEGVRLAMKDAGIADPKDVHYVQTKTPLLTIDWVQDAHRRGKTVACEVHDSMGVSNGTTALGIAVALGEVKSYKAEDVCKNLDLYSSVASCSSGVELDAGQIVLLGNKAGAGGRYASILGDEGSIDARHLRRIRRFLGLDRPSGRSRDLRAG